MKDKENKGPDSEQDKYKDLIKQSISDMKNNYSLSEERQMNIVRVGRNHARKTTVMVSLAILLLIIPFMTLFTYSYYGFGGRANGLIDVAAKTIYVTEPNMSLEEMEIEHDIGFFSMHVLFDVYKRIGKEDYKSGDYDIYFGLDNPSYVKRNYFLERPLPVTRNDKPVELIHPKAPLAFNPKEEWSMLNKLPDGTVAEIYVSLTDLMDPKGLEKLMPGDVELRWFAVDTGLEAGQVNKEGMPVFPIGYPVQIDTTTWSPFNGREKTNEEVFMDILSLIGKNEDTAEMVSNKNLDVQERLKYLKDNGIKVYGAVITGPTPELRKLEQIKEIRAMKVGEVKLWNWK